MKVKKTLAALSALWVVAVPTLTAISMAANSQYPQEWIDAVRFMKENGLSSTANSVEEYQPLATVRREAAAKFFVNFAKKFFNKQVDPTRNCNFSDINEAQRWAVPYIIEACQMGLLKGVNGKFLPKQQLTKLQFLTVLARLVKNNPSIEPVQAFNIMRAEGVTRAASIQDTVRPVTRIELAILFMRAAAKYANQAQQPETQTPDLSNLLGNILGDNNENSASTGNTETNTNTGAVTTTTTANTEESTSTEEGKLTVSLDADSPNNLSVPYNAYHQPVLVFDLRANGKDVKVNEIDLKRVGVGKAEDFDQLALYIDGRRVSDWMTVNSYDDTLVFNRLDINVPANRTVKVELVADMGGSSTIANHQDAFEIQRIDADTEVEGLPLRGGYINLINVAVDPADISLLSLPEKIGRVGEELTVARFKLEAPTSDNVALKFITFVNNGTLDKENLVNFKLYVEGKEVASATWLYSVRGDDLVTLNLNAPYVMEKGTSAVFTLKATLVGGRSDDTIRLDVDDMMLENLSYNVGNRYEEVNSVSTTDRTITVRASKLTIIPESLAQIYPDLRVQVGASDVTLAEYNIFNTSPLEIKGIRFAFENKDAIPVCSGNVPQYSIIRLVDESNNKTLLSTSINCDTVGSQTGGFITNFNGATFDLGTGEHKLAIKVNIPVARADMDGKRVDVKLYAPIKWQEDNGYIRDLVTGKKFTDDDYAEVIPNSDIISDTLTLAVPHIFVGFANFDAQVVVPGKKNVALQAFNEQVTNIGELQLYSPQFKIYIQKNGTLDSTITKNIITSVDLYVNGEKVGTDSPSSDGIVNYDGAFAKLNAKDAAQNQAKIELRANFTNDAAQLSGVTAIYAVANYIENDDTYGNAYILSTTKTDSEYIDGGTNVDAVLGNNTAIVPHLADIRTGGVLAVSANTTDASYSYKFAEADGQTLNKVMKLTLAAQYEKAIVTDLEGEILTGYQAVSEVDLLDANGNIIARTYVGGTGFQFHNLNYIIDENASQDVIVAFKATNGQLATGVVNKTIKLAVNSVKGVGYYSSAQLGGNIDGAVSNSYITAVWFPSALTVTDTKYEGTKMFKFTVTNGGKRAIVLTGVKYIMGNYVGFTGGDTLSGIRLELDNGTVLASGLKITFSGGKFTAEVTGDTANFDDNSQAVEFAWTTDKNIVLNPGETKTFVVKVDDASVDGLSNNDVDSVSYSTTFNRDDAVSFQDGSNSDAYKVGGLRGLNITQTDVSATVKMK